MLESSLRHDLLTCLHQIIGYSELCLEDATGASAISNLQKVAEQARGLVASIHRNRASGESLSAAAVDSMKQSVDALKSDGEISAGDVDRMVAAAQHFRSLISDTPEMGPPGQMAEEVLPNSASAVTAAIAANGGCGLLLVDDNEQNRDLFRRQLERYSYRVQTAATGMEALARLREREFDLVLLDVILPDLNGIEVLRRMKADPKTQDIPVIMISALDEYRNVIECIECGAEDFLPKPLDAVLLRARLKASLDKKALRDEQKREREELKCAYEKLNRMQDQLITQEKLASLGTLTAGIAHEIKNPLNFVTNFARVARELVDEIRENPEPETFNDLEQAMQKIEEHGMRADRIIRGMLMHSRGESGSRQEIEVNSFVGDCVNLAYHGMRAQDSGLVVAIEKRLDPDLGRAEVFPQDLSRVIVNIVQNACQSLLQRRLQSSSFQPVLEISTKNCGDCFELRVRDNGPGIPVPIRDRIFEPFFTTRPPGEGTGLGLSISYDIVVREHAGRIEVRSEENSFTEFIVTLPKNGAATCL